MSNLNEYDISKELWREYDWPARFSFPYRIENPVKLFIRPGGSTHRVVDSEGIVHCVPSVGDFQQVNLRVKKNLNKPDTVEGEVLTSAGRLLEEMRQKKTVKAKETK